MGAGGLVSICAESGGGVNWATVTVAVAVAVAPAPTTSPALAAKGHTASRGHAALQSPQGLGGWLGRTWTALQLHIYIAFLMLGAWLDRTLQPSLPFPRDPAQLAQRRTFCNWCPTT